MLGETITELCRSADKLCGIRKCQFKRGQHQLRFIHGGVRVAADLGTMEAAENWDKEEIGMWEACRVCDKKTESRQMSDGT